jgi:hypothetical protein
MCTTIRITIPPDIDAARVSEALARFTGYSAQPIGRYEIGRYEKDLLLSVEGHYGECQCGTSLGRSAAPQEPDKAAIERSVAKLQRRGWSEAKIRRWLDEQEKTHAKEERTFHVRTRPDTSDAAEANLWLPFLRHLLLTERVDHVGIHVDWRARNQHEVFREEIIDLANADAQLLLSMPSDTVHVFRAEP